MTLVIPNEFVKTPVPKDEERIIMKIRGGLVEILLETNNEKFFYLHNSQTCTNYMETYVS